MSIFLKKFLFFCALTIIVVRPSIAADSLVVIPANPTTSDSIRLSIIIKNWDCCAHFLYDSTDVTLSNDSTITLGFTASLPVIDTLCCIPGTIPVLTYKRGPLPAGNYSVYEQYGICTGQICTDVMIQRLIGKFTVSQQAAVLFRQKPATKEIFGKMPGNVRVYDIRGALVSSNLTGAPKRTSGVYFIKPDGCPAIKVKPLY